MHDCVEDAFIGHYELANVRKGTHYRTFQQNMTNPFSSTVQAITVITHTVQDKHVHDQWPRPCLEFIKLLPSAKPVHACCALM